MSTLAGMRILRINEAHIPPSGGWLATVQLDSSVLPSIGPSALVIGDLTLRGSIIRTDFDDHPGGGLVMAVAQGGAGWRLPVAQQGRYEGGSVRLSTVLEDIAEQAGEAFDAPSDRSVGDAYQWEAHTPAAPVHCRDVLNDLVWRGYLPTWRVDPGTGRTRFDGWPARGRADGRGRVTGRAGSRGRRVVGLDVQVAAFLPGATLEGTTITRTVIREDSGSLSVDVYSAAGRLAA